MSNNIDTGLLLKGGLLADGTTADILIRDGKIAEISDGLTAPQNVREIDVAGRLVAPGLVDGHVHLDKTLLGGPWIPHSRGGTVVERIAAEKDIRARNNTPLETRATALIDLLTEQGTVALRSHVDIDPEIGLANLEVILALLEKIRDRVSIQLVAFP
ncbi:MAG: hypothetical protein O3B21_16845 [Proteobacteria bacterium]|nr:hypothetical protein [Pseudomonadota bacterium]MDA1357968.1 hypothetical protein [Pseudomonadota bacterium]